MYVALIGKSLAFRRGARTWILYSSEDVQLDSNRTTSHQHALHRVRPTIRIKGAMSMTIQRQRDTEHLRAG